MAAPRPLRHTPHEDRGPIGSSTESGSHKAVFTTAYGWVLRQDIFFGAPPRHLIADNIVAMY
eukprot:9361092-Pyramimonas_sp.AAC.1